MGVDPSPKVCVCGGGTFFTFVNRRPGGVEEAVGGSQNLRHGEAISFVIFGIGEGSKGNFSRTECPQMRFGATKVYDF